MESDSASHNKQDFGKFEYGCEHYRRRCKIRAPCCDQILSCRHCHNEATSSLSNPKERHEIDRHDIKQVVCSICNTEQQVAQICSNCGVKMGEYFCGICKFYDDDTQKMQFHCDECGICRYRCPFCCKTMLDMSAVWRLLDEEIEVTSMPLEYQHKVSILCNDCNRCSNVPFHILGHKCSNCNSYNTCRISAPSHE